jgi:hypothetical protein
MSDAKEPTQQEGVVPTKKGGLSNRTVLIVAGVLVAGGLLFLGLVVSIIGLVLVTKSDGGNSDKAPVEISRPIQASERVQTVAPSPSSVPSSSSENDLSIVGTWRGPDGAALTLNRNGTGTIRGVKMKWEADGSTLSISVHEDDDPMDTDYELENSSTLILTDDDGTSTTLRKR